MKKNMLLAIVIATFFSCTEILDEIELSEAINDELINKDSTSNDELINKDSTSTIIPSDSISDNTSDTTDEHGSEKLGVFITKQEIEIWRSRTNTGPYKSSGDVSPNSPGSWERIVQSKNKFMNNPSASRWTNTSLRPPNDQNALMRDAAFYAMIKSDKIVAEEVLKQINWMINNINFSDRSVFGIDGIDKVDGHGQAQGITKYIYSFIYVNVILNSDDSDFKNWILDWGHYMNKNLNMDLNNYFTDRLNGNYNYKGSEWRKQVLYYGGPNKVGLSGVYNNRKGNPARTIGMIGILCNDLDLKENAKRFFKEWMIYAVYPEGVNGDFERWTEKLPDLGYGYGVNMVAHMVHLADLFARTGDTELYDYKTKEGLYDTKCESGDPTKSLLFHLKEIGKHLDGTYMRYGTDNKDKTGNASYLIDGKHGNWQHTGYTIMAMANLYYQDNYLRSIYTATAPGMGYPSNATPIATGEPDGWSGDGGTLVSPLFMYGGLEGKVWPYSIGNKQ